MEQSLQQIIDKTVQNDGPAGTVFGAVWQDKDGKWQTCAVAGGEQELGSGKKAKPDSVFALYSCTKMIAGIACMQAVEQGVLALDDPALVEKHLPELASRTFVDGRKPKNKITLRHLLTHTAGLCYTFFHPDGKKWSEQNDGLDEFEGSIKSMMGPLVHEPGTDWQYSTGIDWAGELLKRVSGKSLSQWSKEYIFDPLGADDIGYGVQPQHKGRLMAMHQRGKDGKLSVRDHMQMTTKGASFDSGGAGCVGTIHDYLKVIVVLLNNGVGANGARILKEETLREMLTDQLPGIVGQEQADKAMNREIPDVTPELTNSIQMMPGIDKGWGITFQILKGPLPTGRQSKAVWWAGLPNNFWQADPTSKVGTMILSQSFPFNDPKVIMPWLELEAEVYKHVKA